MNDSLDEDIKFFRDAVADVKPLKTQVKAHDRPKPKPYPNQRIADEQKVIEELADNLSDEWQELSGDELNYCRDGISRQIMRRLRNGRYIIEAELDLHGLRRDQAKQELVWFIQQCQLKALRCVRIIHGKGQRSPNKQPVLKSKTAAWLKQMDEILAYCTAPNTDGGTGALYVLLKRRT